MGELIETLASTVQVGMRGGTIKCGFLRLYGNKLRLRTFAGNQDASSGPYRGTQTVLKLATKLTFYEIQRKYIILFLSKSKPFFSFTSAHMGTYRKLGVRKWCRYGSGWSCPMEKNR